MRKIIGGVAMHPTEMVEWYFVSVKNEDNTYENLLYEKFDRKKPYGVDFIIETANTELTAGLTPQEIEWLRTVDVLEFQQEIQDAATSVGNE
jgi:hypothetical protein